MPSRVVEGEQDGGWRKRSGQSGHIFQARVGKDHHIQRLDKLERVRRNPLNPEIVATRLFIIKQVMPHPGISGCF